VVLTGTRDATIIGYLNIVGAKQGSSVSKNTSLVIAPNVDDDTGKIKDAKKLNIPIMTVTAFIQTFIHK
jgi:NAD-dependent DNA ligase